LWSVGGFDCHGGGALVDLIVTVVERWWSWFLGILPWWSVGGVEHFEMGRVWR